MSLQRLANERGAAPDLRRDSDGADTSGGHPGQGAATGLVQRCVIIQKDERGYGLTVSGDNPVYVASVKAEGAAAKAGVQKDDRIVKVNGTLVTNRNHIDVVKLIKSGSYVALTLMGRPNSASSPGSLQPGSSPFPSRSSSTSSCTSNRDSLITAPQPVDPDKDRELLQRKVHMTQVMFEQAKEDFEKLQRQYVKTPSEKLHTQLLEKERTVKTLENQLKQLTVTEEPATPTFPQGSQRVDMDTDSSSINSWESHGSRDRAANVKHVKQNSAPASSVVSGEGRSGSTHVMRSKSDAASRRRAGMQSTFYVGLGVGGTSEATAEGGNIIQRRLKRWASYCSARPHRPLTNQTPVIFQATSLPVSDGGSVSDSPQTSPSISPVPVHADNHYHQPSDTDDTARPDSTGECLMPVQAEIITIDDEDVNSDNEQTCDTGPFSDIRLVEKKPAHMGVLLHYLISNSDPCALFFYIVTDAYKQSAGNSKDLRKWGYEIFSTFLAPSAPLHVQVSEILVDQVNEVLAAVPGSNVNDTVLRNMFDASRSDLSAEINEQLADFRSKRDLGLGNIFGVHELVENMEKSKELKMIEKYLMPHLLHCTQEESGRKLTDRDQAVGWALATFFRQVGVNKTSSSSGILERVQSFIMKDKRGFKIPGSRSTKAKAVKGHQFNLQHFYVPTFCSKCEGLIWGVGYQGFLCQSCEMGVHKQCMEDVVEVCIGRKRGKRASAFIPVINTSRKPSNPNQQAGQPSYSVTEALGQAMAGETKSPPHTSGETSSVGPITHPLKKDDDSDLASLPTAHSVRSIVNKYHEMATSPTGPGPGEDDQRPLQEERKTSSDLSRSESLKGKGDKAERPQRRAKSDVDRNDLFQAINPQSGSSSASSLSNRSVESPSASTEHVNEALAAARAQNDSDLEVDELPPLKQVLGEDRVKKLKPKEKRRQEVINELFHTERAHLRNLKVLDLLFNHPMLNETGVMPELARGLFPNIEEMISLHASMNKVMKERRSQDPVVGDVGDILLERFDKEQGDRFRQACAAYCRNQSFALDALKRHRRKDQRLAQFLAETESDKLCRKLELKDHVPCQMQRLTKYPMLIENLMKYTSSTSSKEYRDLERALSRTKWILDYVNQAVRECENYHKLKDMQKKLDCRAIDASSDPSLMDIKKLDLTKHKLVHDGPLVWRLRSHRLIELHVLLMDDILVLLQRVDDRLVLKCMSTNHTPIGNDYKYTHSPVLKLQNLLARDVATDKKAFFVINTSDTGPQIYELVAQTQDARKTWCKLINEKAEQKKEQKKAQGNTSHLPHVSKGIPNADPEEVVLVRNQVIRKSQERTPPPADEGEAAAPAFSPPAHDEIDITSLALADYQPELIQPDQVSVSGAVTTQAQAVLSPLERLRRNNSLLEQALQDREEIVADILHLSLPGYRHIAQQRRQVHCPVEDEEFDEQSLVVLCMETINRLIRLISLSASNHAISHSESASDSGSSTAQPSSLPCEAEPESSQLRVQQEMLAQGAASQSVNVPVPMDQLRGMANEMNSILSNLLNVMGTRGAERQSLRGELAAAQQQLEMLKNIQRQMMEQQSQQQQPESRPHSFVSVASSISEMGEGTDGDSTEDDTNSALKRAHTEELLPEMEEATEETVRPLVTQVQATTTTASDSDIGDTTLASSAIPDDDSDDNYEMIPENLPLPDETSVGGPDTPFTPGPTSSSTSAVPASEEEEAGGSSVDPGAGDQDSGAEPMVTDLDEAGDDDRSTPTPSPTPMSTVTEEGAQEECEEGEGESLGKADNNNSTHNQDSELTNPIEI